MPDFKVVIATCYGAANTGQLAGAVATELAKENEGYALVCLPAVAIEKESGLKKIRDAEVFVIIEGCPVMCCSKIVEEHAGREPDLRVEMVRDYGVKKVGALEYEQSDKERIKVDIKQRIDALLVAKVPG
jgi:uncharacterized metal-binding protein